MDTEKDIIVKYEGVDLERAGNAILSDINLTIKDLPPKLALSFKKVALAVRQLGVENPDLA